MYGSWQDNHPQGLTVLRLNDCLVFAHYEEGRIVQDSKILVVLEQFHIGVIIVNDYEWKVIHKGEVYCQEHVISLLSLCQYRNQPV